MSAPSAILSLLQGSKSAPPNPTESMLGDAAEADSAYFVALVKQNIRDLGPEQAAKPAKLASEPGSKDADSSEEASEMAGAEAVAAFGNLLPSPVALGLPVGTSASAPNRDSPAVFQEAPAANGISAKPVDTQLEDFAVGMGIDRGLAKLLLQQTALDTAPRSVPIGATATVSAVPAVANATSAPAPALVVALQTATMPNALLVEPQPLTIVSSEGSAVLPSVSLTTGAGLIAKAVDMGVASDVEAPVLPSLEIAETLSDEDVLRWRAVAHRSEVISPLRELPTDGVVALEAELAQTLSDSDFVVASAALRGMTLDHRVLGTVVDTPNQLAGVAAGSAIAVASISSIGGAAAGNVGQSLVPAPAETIPPVRVPDGSLPIEQRAEEFAEQVGRRLLQQIRESRWSVSLQLDPQHLGPMDIELQLEGNQVVASVAVANPDVRHLLESALPKLRESLDSAGLNLAGWSFAQSGSRESRDFAEQFVALGGVKGRIAEEASVNPGIGSGVRDEQSTRAVDVYV